jgi:hemoglobin-like flavoprotein
MNPEQKKLVQQSFQTVLTIADTAAELFYNRLFELDPSLKWMFKGDMREQGRKLMSMLRVAVNGLDRLEALIPAVRELGRRHIAYGVKDSHYYTVGSALLWTLEQGLGEAFTPAVRTAWIEAYTLLSAVMREGATKAA